MQYINTHSFIHDIYARLKNLGSLEALIDLIRFSQKITGAKFTAMSKAEAMWLGAARFSSDEHLGLTCVRKIKFPGVLLVA